MVKWACCHFSETENIRDINPLYCSLASTHIGGKGYLSGFPLPSWSQVSVLTPPHPLHLLLPSHYDSARTGPSNESEANKNKKEGLGFFLLTSLPLLAASLDFPLLPHTLAG